MRRKPFSFSADEIKTFSDEGKDFLIWLLYRLIDIELNEPEELIDEACIFEYAKTLDLLLPDIVVYSEEEIEERLRLLKMKAAKKRAEPF